MTIATFLWIGGKHFESNPKDKIYNWLKITSRNDYERMTVTKIML